MTGQTATRTSAAWTSISGDKACEATNTAAVAGNHVVRLRDRATRTSLRDYRPFVRAKAASDLSSEAQRDFELGIHQRNAKGWRGLPRSLGGSAAGWYVSRCDVRGLGRRLWPGIFSGQCARQQGVCARHAYGYQGHNAECPVLRTHTRSDNDRRRRGRGQSGRYFQIDLLIGRCRSVRERGAHKKSPDKSGLFQR